MNTIQEVIRFWFEDTAPDKHFAKDEEFDALIKTRFGQLYWDALNGKTAKWRQTPDGRLAEVLVLDQFARNIFRNAAQAFTGDVLALTLAAEAIGAGADMEVAEYQRVFFYMPYMHSESLPVHNQAVRLFTTYGSDVHLEYELKHKAVLEKFGRYPHRNAALGRESTSEELVWLEAGGGF